MTRTILLRHVLPVSAALLAGLLAGCSNDSNRSSGFITVKVQAGQEDLDEAIIRHVAVTEGGDLQESQPGAVAYTPYISDAEGQVESVIVNDELSYFDVYGRQAGEDQVQTTRRCQLADGCGSYAFGEAMPVTGSPGWRTVAVGLSRNERIRLTPLTDLAAQLAYSMVYSESSAGDQQDSGWLTTGGYYSAYSTVQSVSQISRIFGITDVQTTEPADLTQLNDWRNANEAEATDSIRYGALLAAWQSYELEYTVTDDAEFFARAVGADMITNNAQIYQRGGDQTLSLYDLYARAADNLEKISVEGTALTGYVDTVVTGLRSDMASFADGALTTRIPAPLSELLGADLDAYELGLDRVKAFVDVLRDYETSFFEEGYRAELDSYMDQLDSIGDLHADDLDQLMLAYVHTFEFYRNCYLNSGCPAPDSSWTWLENYDYNAATATLTINDGEIEVTQGVADLNTTDDDDNPASSQAIDVFITGGYRIGNVQLSVDHTYESDSSDVISTPSGVRVFYGASFSTLQDPVSEPEIAYQLRWADASLYDVTTVGTETETELTGSYFILYRGVEDPSGAGEMHYNIESVVLNGRISDVVGDDSEDDQNISSVFVSAQSTNPAEYYADSQFASFNGFFSPSESSVYTDGYVSSGLVSYRTGSETINGQDVEYFDYYVKDGESYRYRFYPTVYRQDTGDSDRDGDRDEDVATFDYEQCDLSGGSSAPVVQGCEPKQRLYSERNMQEAINELWEVGVFSRPEIDGQGGYFVEFPVEAPDAHGCLALSPLPETLTSLDGTLYRPIVLGLNTLRATTEVILEYDGNTSTNEPKTLLDLSVSAPFLDVLEGTAALSHDYSAVSTSSDVYMGTGSNLDRLLINYSRSNETLETGDLDIYKDGVSLTLADGSEDVVNSEILTTGMLNKAVGAPLYHFYVDDDGLLNRCVTQNVAEADTQRETDDTVWVLNYRDVVYGRIAMENGVWIIRYIDGSWESLL
ncbi:MAG: hypothetical protein CMI00_09755 [Oceanospirillaceae bacterium]|nr:hypothetical protein [Oceanospirillaceae bacterium]